MCDGLYAAEMQELESNIESFRYIPTFSREDPSREDIRKGYVHQVYEEICKDKTNGELPPAHFYLCGWKNMIDEAKQRILALGYDRKAIHQELYG